MVSIMTLPFQSHSSFGLSGCNSVLELYHSGENNPSSAALTIFNRCNAHFRNLLPWYKSSQVDQLRVCCPAPGTSAPGRFSRLFYHTTTSPTAVRYESAKAWLAHSLEWVYAASVMQPYESCHS